MAALNKFKADSELQEFWAITTVNGDKVFRYLSPLIIDETCLSCHGEPQGEYDISGYQKEGYELGSLGGAISLTMPMDISIQNIKANLISNAVFFLVLMLACIIIIYFLATRLVIRSLGELEGAVGEVGRGNLNINLSN